MGKGRGWIVKWSWQISGQSDRERSEEPSELPHFESGLLGLYMSTLLRQLLGEMMWLQMFSASAADPEGDDCRQLSTDGAPYTRGASPSFRKGFGRSFTIVVTVPSFKSPFILKAAPTGFLKACLPEEKVMILLITGKQKTQNVCSFSDLDRNKCIVEQDPWEHKQCHRKHEVPRGMARREDKWDHSIYQLIHELTVFILFSDTVPCKTLYFSAFWRRYSVLRE